MQGPLRAVIVVPPNCPRFCLRLDQRPERLPDCGLLSMPALPYPGRVDMLRHVICVCVGEEPGDEGRDHGRQNKSPGARQSAPRNARKCGVMVPGARLADGPYGIHVSRDEEEYGDGAATTDGQAEEGQLEEVRCHLGAVGGRV